MSAARRLRGAVAITASLEKIRDLTRHAEVSQDSQPRIGSADERRRDHDARPRRDVGTFEDVDDLDRRGLEIERDECAVQVGDRSA